MCDYCDCRSHPEIAALSAEHEQLGWFAREVEQALRAGDAAGAHGAFDRLVSLLSAHTATEEGGLFTILLAAGELTGAIGDRCAEHDEIAVAVDAVTAARSRPGGWETPARRVLDLLAEHIWQEETDVFPAAGFALSAISMGATR